MSTTTAQVHNPYAPRTVVREVRQIARCKRCKSAKSRLVTRTTRVSYFGKFPPERDATSVDTVNGERPDHDAGPCSCGRPMYYLDVSGRVNDHACDARCLAATGHDCECSCGGLNHGAAHG